MQEDSGHCEKLFGIECINVGHFFLLIKILVKHHALSISRKKRESNGKLEGKGNRALSWSLYNQEQALLQKSLLQQYFQKKKTFIKQMLFLLHLASLLLFMVLL